MSRKADRFERRLAERRAQRADEQEETPKPPPSEPLPEERRKEDRRKASMTASEVDDWLKRNGISGGDRRKGQRRKR